MAAFAPTIASECGSRTAAAASFLSAVSCCVVASFLESAFRTKVEFEAWDSLPDDKKAAALPGSQW